MFGCRHLRKQLDALGTIVVAVEPSGLRVIEARDEAPRAQSRPRAVSGRTRSRYMRVPG